MHKLFVLERNNGYKLAKKKNPKEKKTYETSKI